MMATAREKPGLENSPASPDVPDAPADDWDRHLHAVVGGRGLAPGAFRMTTPRKKTSTNGASEPPPTAESAKSRAKPKSKVSEKTGDKPPSKSKAAFKPGSALGGPTTLDVGMIVITTTSIAPDWRRVVDVTDHHVVLEPLGPGTTSLSVPISDVKRYRLRTTDSVLWQGQPVQVMRPLNPWSEGLYRYEIALDEERATEVPESQLALQEAMWGADPGMMLAHADAQSWESVSARQQLVASFFRATAKSVGLTGYTGARMLPIPHQVSAARHVVLSGRPRFLLADEVGLGKTIEAGLIVSTLKKYFPAWKTAVFVPESLTVQWAFEFYGKFGKLVFCLDPADFDEDDPGIIVPHSVAPRFATDAFQPDILVVDEAHRVLTDAAQYDALLALSEKAQAVLLLTANPRADQLNNLKRLLTLVDPERFAGLSTERLGSKLDAQPAVEETIRRVRATLANKEKGSELVLAGWKGSKLHDADVDSLIEKLGKAKANARRNVAHRLINVITDRHHPGSRVIRYQRKFLARDNAMATRIVSPTSYVPGAEEKAVLELLNAWLALAKMADITHTPEGLSLVGTAIQAAHSSPLAFEQFLKARAGIVERPDRVTVDPILLNAAGWRRIPLFDGEQELLDRLNRVNTAWDKALKPDRLTGFPLSLSPRMRQLENIVDEVKDENPPPHLLIFTSFETNVKPIHAWLKKKYPYNIDIFAISAEMAWRDRERAAFSFQDCRGPSILISDELGGEGRNFQFVTTLVHWDLPPAAWLIEQRIGRCDRVGRDEELDIDQRVLVTRGRLDETIFEYMAEGVNVFNESIAPIENRLDDVSKRMIGVLLQGGGAALLEAIDVVAADLAAARETEERDLLARDRVGVAEARRLATELDDKGELEELRKHTIGVATMKDSMVDERSNGQVAITVGEFHPLHNRPGVRGDMIGYFDRRSAVRHERLEFFSPGHPFVRAQALSMLDDAPDRVALVLRPGLKKPAFLFWGRLSLSPGFFEEISKLPMTLQPPLLCQSAASFGTTLVPLWVDPTGRLIDASKLTDLHNVAPLPGDVSLHDIPQAKSLMPPDWSEVCAVAAEAAIEELERRGDARLTAGRPLFESLLADVLTREEMPAEAFEERLAAILDPLQQLDSELDSAVAFFPMP